MKHLKLLTILISVLFFTGCGEFGDVNLDPNAPSKMDPCFMFTKACTQVPAFVISGMYDPWTQIYPQYFSERQNVQFTNFSGTWYGTDGIYTQILRSLDLIIRCNTEGSTVKALNVGALGSTANQLAVCRTLRAFIYMHMTDILGMIPYSEALQGDEGNFNPKYDTQEFIYTDLDRDLKEAYVQFDDGGFDGTADILYNGNISSWKKLNASIRMMMAIKLSDVNPAEGKARFAAAFNDGGIINNEDNLVYRYLKESANENPLYNNIVVAGRQDFSPSKTLIDYLHEYNDPRLEVYAAPNSDGEYVGVPFGITQDEISHYKNCSEFAPGLYKQNTPFTVISASRILLLEAEAAVRGWISADAEKLYREGIQASLELHGVGDSFDVYIDQPLVAFAGSEQEKIEKIAMQRWLGGFLQDGVEVWSDWRRLNVPQLKPGPAATVTHIPYRRCYYTTDYDTNRENHEAALSQQGEDSFDTKVWWDTKDNE